jgi:glycosyltransferase involved in cell wall biosynthesis
MRVCIVSPDPSSTSGGVERFCHTLRAALAGTRAWDVEVIGAGDHHAASRADCIITNGMTSIPGLAVPRVHVYHGCWVEHMRYDHRQASRAWRVRRTVEGAFKEARHGLGATRVAVSNSAAREVRRWYGLGSVVIPNAIDTDLFRPLTRPEARRALDVGPDERLALFPGRPEDRKRPDVAVQACLRAGFTLLHAGRTPMPGAKELGPLSPENMALWYAAADAVISSSDYEAASLAVLESLSVGTPVVGTRVGWLSDLEGAVPEYGALLGGRGDARRLAECLGGLDDARPAVASASALVRRGSRYARVLERTLT